MRVSPKSVQDFRKFIFGWWELHRRDLPWRRTRDPYKILVSEVMLQQTQVVRVLPKYEEFLYFFPDIYALSHASPAKVLKVWKGMGYNRRALYLRRAAQAIVGTYHGEFPKDLKLLAKLPGVGNYTARALLVFAYGQDIGLVDTNIRKIITHFFFSGKPQKASAVQSVADTLVPVGKSWEWHQALMDYGAMQMKNEKLKMKNVMRKETPFKNSNRFYRGRIVDLLRERDYSVTELLEHMIRRYQRDREYFLKLLGDLEQEGLVSLQRKIYSLPR